MRAARRPAAGPVELLLLVLALLLPSGPAFARTPTERELETFRTGNRAYEAGNYEAAVGAYESLLKTGLESRDVYYNLGNAWLKQGRLGPSILNYRRVLNLDPSDDDARANLNYARARTQDATPQEAPDPFPWLTAIRPGGERAGILYLLALNLLALLFAARRLTRWAPAALGPLVTGSAALTVVLGVLFYFEARAESRKGAGVVMVASSDVRSGPGQDYTVAFVVHEGTEVSLGRSTTGWTEITVTPELKGWVSASAVESVE